MCCLRGGVEYMHTHMSVYTHVFICITCSSMRCLMIQSKSMDVEGNLISE